MESAKAVKAMSASAKATKVFTDAKSAKAYSAKATKVYVDEVASDATPSALMDIDMSFKLFTDEVASDATLSALIDIDMSVPSPSAPMAESKETGSTDETVCGISSLTY